MAKKHRKTLQQKLKKRQQLEQLTASATTAPTAEAATTELVTELPLAADAPVLASKDNHLKHEVTHTLVSFVFIVALLVGAVILDHRTPYLGELGSWLYQNLRLAS